MADTIPVPLVLWEPADSVPYTFSPVAPGYFMPSPGWAMKAKTLEKGSFFLTYAPSPRILLWSAQHLRNLLSRAAAALADVMPTILQADYRGLKSPTPPPLRHRLAELHRLLSPLIYLYTSEARPFIDPMLVAELHAIVVILERAAKEPVWAEIRPTCEDPQNFLHTLITFLTIEMLERTQRLVHPTLTTSLSTREPDITIDVGSRVHLEVKVPRVLVRTPLMPPDSLISAAEAAELVEKVAREAVGSRGQIRSDRPGMLVVGGFCLHGDEINHIEAAARLYMIRRGRRYPFLTAIGVTGLLFGRNPSLYGAARAMPGFNFVTNPSTLIPFP